MKVQYQQCTNFPKRSHLKILGERRVIWRKVHTDNLQTGATAQNSIATATWHLEFVHPCSTLSIPTCPGHRYSLILFSQPTFPKPVLMLSCHVLLILSSGHFLIKKNFNVSHIWPSHTTCLACHYQPHFTSLIMLRDV